MKTTLFQSFFRLQPLLCRLRSENRLTMVAAATILLAACGGGGGSPGVTGKEKAHSVQPPTAAPTSAPPAPVVTVTPPVSVSPTPVIKTGVLIDSPVIGARFRTATQSGYTDANGMFRYKAGETLTFSVGRITLGTAKGAKKVFIDGVTVPGTSQPSRVTSGRIGQLLQTLDVDGNPQGSIDLRIGSARLKQLQGLAFNVSTQAAFDRQLQKAVADAGIAATPVPFAQARQHLDSQNPNITITVTPTAVPVTPTAVPVTPTAVPVTPTAVPVTPTAVPVTPTAVPVTPTTVPVTPTAAPVTPTTVPVTPTAVPVTSTAAPVTPTTVPVTPTAAPVTPTTVPVTPTAVPVTPTAAPVTPTTVPVTPTAVPVTPTAVPVTPTTVPVTPTAAPVTPTAVPVTPTTVPVTPTTVPVTPTAVPVTPTAAPVTPTAVPVTPTTVPVTPTAVPVTPTAVPVTPTAVPVTPTAVPVTPTAVPVTPTAVPVTPTAIPVTPTAIPVTPTAIPVTPTAIPVTPTAVPVTPTAIPVTPTAVPVTPTAIPVTATPAPVYTQQPDISNCQPGELSQAEKDKALAHFNYIRSLHRLPPVTYDSSSDAMTAQSALIMVANGKLSHRPASSWACHTAAGYTGSEKSNLFLRYNSSAATFSTTAALNELLIDNDVASLGHRRWMLHPLLKFTAIGRAEGNPKTGSQTGYYFTAVSHRVMFDQEYADISSYNLEYVAYPYKDYPSRLFKKDWFLSFSAIASNTSRYENRKVDYESATVQVTNAATGAAMTVSERSQDIKWYGNPNNLQWKVAGLQNNVRYNVSIENVKVNGVNKNYSYYFKLQ